MDSENLAHLQRMCPKRHESKLKLFLPTYAPELKMQDTPDPYYVGGYDGVVSAVETAVKGLIKAEGFKWNQRSSNLRSGIAQQNWSDTEWR